MIHEIVSTMAGRCRSRDAGAAIHAYPTLSESVKGAMASLRRTGRILETWRPGR